MENPAPITKSSWVSISATCPPRITCRCGVFLPLLLTILVSSTFAAETLVLRGRLQADPGQPPAEDAPLVLISPSEKRTTLFGDLFSEGQLRDPRLAAREWELEGSLAADGRFEIRKLFTIKDSRRHRVTYYCEICHIYTHEPGRCMCCQEETELREIPEP